MDNVNKEVVEFYKKLGYTLIDIKSSVFREEESTLVFQTDNKNHTVDGSTILYDHAVAIHHQLQKAREKTIRDMERRMMGWSGTATAMLKDYRKIIYRDHSELDQDVSNKQESLVAGKDYPAWIDKL